ncbi:MAG TPA: aminotransferase class V-fold PLP-dependent enzyme [Actinomycetes bacterium]|nr:aminotransferase class V-fold PLP-dependent enzyme [Actinomycetes bacterium]
MPLSTEFGPFHGRSWLNCAHQGPLPRPALLAALEALELKRTPVRLSDSLFVDVPERLRAALARLVGGRPESIALTNSTSYGLNLLAQGMPWRSGDEILFVDGDFPATVVPWLPLRRKGVSIRLIQAPGARLDAERLAAEIRPRTRAVCTSWVFSFFGHTLDLAQFGQVCHDHDVFFFVNASQGVGARPLDLSRLPVDALSSCGFKWLCGPYATGFVWLSPPILEALDFPNPHWLRLQQEAASSGGGDLNRSLDYTLPPEIGAHAYDVYCAPNFLNFMTWTGALEHLLDLGIKQIAEHDQALVERLLSKLPDSYRLESPRAEPERSTLVLISHRDRDRNSAIADYLRRHGVDIALRNDTLRLSPHLYNSRDDIERAIELLAEAA